MKNYIDWSIIYDTCIEEIRDIINGNKDVLNDIDSIKDLKVDFIVNKSKNIQALVVYSKQLDWYCKINDKEHDICLLTIKNYKDTVESTVTDDELIDITARFKYEFNDAFNNAFEELKKYIDEDTIVSFIKENLYNKIAKKDKEDDYELENS